MCARAGCGGDGIRFTWPRRAHAHRLNGSSSLYPRTAWRDAWLRLDGRCALEADAPLDAERILRALAEHEVDYVIVGGLAVQVHGHVRTTVDIDVVPGPERSNLVRLAAALNALDARVLNPGHEQLRIDAAMLPRATLWQFATPNGSIDVLHDAPGAPSYEELRRRAVEIRLGDLSIAVSSRDDLIGMKRASARAIDLEDIAALTEPESGADHPNVNA
jgi:hypothetical protein